MNSLFSSQAIFQKQGLAIIRILVGLLLVYHGWEVFNAAQINEYAGWDIFKNTSFPLLLPYLGKSAELVGGLLLALGLFTRLTTGLLALTMLYITFFIGHGKFWYEDQHPFLFILLALIYFFAGAGEWSLDKIINKK